MFHLQYVKATPREMMEEELTEHVAKTGKINRRKHRSTYGLKNKNESDSSDSEAVGSTVKSSSGTTQVFHSIKELKMPGPTPQILLDQCIQSKTAMIGLLQKRHGKEEEIVKLEDEIFELLKKKAQIAFQQFELTNTM